MSRMYGKHRVTLETRATRLGNHWVSIRGSESGQGGTYFPIGYWYKDGSLFYVDLMAYEQLYSSAGVNRQTIGHKRLGGFANQKAVREFVMAYYKAYTNEPSNPEVFKVFLRERAA